MPFTEDELEKCTVRKGDLLVCEGGDIGRAAVWNQDYEIRIQNHIHKLRGLGGVNHRLFMFWFMFMKEEGMIGGKGIGLMGLSSRELDKLIIPLPPLYEQSRLVDRIDGLFSVVNSIEITGTVLSETVSSTKARILDLAIHGKLVPQDPSDEPAIELLKRINPDFRPSDNLHYSGVLPFGWIKCRLYDICDILDSRRRPVNSKERSSRIENASFLYPYFGATGQVGFIDDFLLDGTYILLGEDGAPFLDKKADKAYPVQGKIWVNNHAHILDPKVNFGYVLLYLNSIDYRRYVSGTTRLKLTQESMKSIEIDLPPLKEQSRIVVYVQQALSLLDNLRSGIEDGE